VSAALPTSLRSLLPLLGEVGDLKRLRVAGSPDSLMAGLFARAWSALLAGEPVERVAHRETAAALVAVRLPGYGAALAELGRPADESMELLRRAFDDAAAPLAAGLVERLRPTVVAVVPPTSEPPAFARRLAEQPRAGATRPGRPRLVLVPFESHAEHCGAGAVYGALLSPLYGAEPGLPFLCGLAHHLHNAILPDPGHAGDTLLAEREGELKRRATEQVMGELPDDLHAPVRAALDLVYKADTPEARSFQAADVLDRVLEMRWHARTAAFTLEEALGELDLVHDGPVAPFHQRVMADAGLA
jgi:hypothetical protein